MEPTIMQITSKSLHRPHPPPPCLKSPTPARLAFLTTRCEFRRRKKKPSWRRRRRRRPQHRFATKGSFPSFLPSLRRARRGSPLRPLERASERATTPTRNWSAKRLCKSGRLSCPGSRPRALARTEAIERTSPGLAAWGRFLPPPARPALYRRRVARPAHRHPDAAAPRF